MAAPPFSLPSVAPHSPHVSTTVCPAIYAIAIAAISQVIPCHGFLPRPRRLDATGAFLYTVGKHLAGRSHNATDFIVPFYCINCRL